MILPGATVDPAQLTALTPEVVCICSSSYAICGVLTDGWMDGWMAFVLVLRCMILSFMLAGRWNRSLISKWVVVGLLETVEALNRGGQHQHHLCMLVEDKSLTGRRDDWQSKPKSEGSKDTQVASKILLEVGGVLEELLWSIVAVSMR